MERFTIRSRGYLPHWEMPGATYHIVYRLADSLPRNVIRELLARRARIRLEISGARRPTPSESLVINSLFSPLLDRQLDVGYGSFSLKELAPAIAENLRHFERVRYRLHAWCVMPNHVHVIIEPYEGQHVWKIVHSWKSYIAHRAGRHIWAREYFDHIIRTDAELLRTIEYVEANPAKAGLPDWPWTS